MKSGVIRSAGVAIAMLLPISGIGVLTAGTAGATTTGVELTSGTHFTFTAKSKTAIEDCTNSSGASVWSATNHTAFTDNGCVTTPSSGSFTTIGTASSAHLHVLAHGLTLTTTNHTLTLESGDVVFHVDFGGSTTCAVTLGSVVLSGRGTTYTVSGHTLSGVAVTPHAATTNCGKLTTLLKTPEAQFGVTLVFNMTP